MLQSNIQISMNASLLPQESINGPPPINEDLNTRKGVERAGSRWS